MANILVHAFLELLGEPMNFIAEDNIYLLSIWESRQNSRNCALASNYGQRKRSMQKLKTQTFLFSSSSYLYRECWKNTFAVSVLLFRIFLSFLEKHLPKRAINEYIWTHPYFLWLFICVRSNSHLLLARSLVIISRSIIHKGKLKINYAHVFWRERVAVTRQQKKDGEKSEQKIA